MGIRLHLILTLFAAILLAGCRGGETPPLVSLSAQTDAPVTLPPLITSVPLSNTATRAVTTAKTPRPTATRPPTRTPMPTPVENQRATPEPTFTPPPTHTPQPTATPDPVGNWQVPVVDLHWAEKGYYYSTWMNDASIILEGAQLGMIVLDARTGEMLSILTPTPKVIVDDKAWLREPSSAGDFEIACTEAGLAMYHLPDRQLISQSGSLISNCHSVLWNNDASAASFISDAGDVYVWWSDGTPPRLVGKGLGATLSDLALWSPDNKKLLVVGHLISNTEATFNIAYSDGRSVKTTGAIIEVGNQWEGSTTWFTNEIVRNIRGYRYSYEDYYHADSGKFLIRNSIGEGGGQEAFLSPDQRWLVLEASPNADRWEDLYTFSAEDETLLVLYDLKALKKHVWASGQPSHTRSAGTSFEFIGWNADSSRFYFAHFPFGHLSSDLPTGYLVLDRGSLQTQLVVPNVLYTQPSRDSQHIFMVTAGQIEPNMAYGVQAAVYTLDGKPVTQPQRIAEQLPFDELNPTDFFNEGSYDPYSDLIPSRWNRDSTQVAFAIPGGEVWLMGTDGSVQLLLSDLPFVEEYWQEDVRFSWPPEGNFLFFRWGDHAWIAQIHGP